MENMVRVTLPRRPLTSRARVPPTTGAAFSRSCRRSTAPRITSTRPARPGGCSRGSRAPARPSAPPARARPARRPARSAASWPSSGTCRAPPLHETIVAFHDTPASARRVRAGRRGGPGRARRRVPRRGRSPAGSAGAGLGPGRPRGARPDPRAPHPQRREDRERALRRGDPRGDLRGGPRHGDARPRPLRLRRPCPLGGQRLGRGRAGPLARVGPCPRLRSARRRLRRGGGGGTLGGGAGASRHGRRGHRLRAGHPLPRRPPGRRPLLPHPRVPVTTSTVRGRSAASPRVARDGGAGVCAGSPASPS